MQKRMIATLTAAALVISCPAYAQSDMEMAREVYPVLVECSIVTGLSAQFGYSPRHSADEWIELIAPTAAMIGAEASEDMTAAADAIIERNEREGTEATQAYITDRAQYCDAILDSL